MAYKQHHLPTYIPSMFSLRLRSFLFNVGWYVGTTIIAIVGAPILLLPRRYVVAWSLFWIDFCLGWLRLTCRLTHRVRGLENLPAGPVILACKHQSSWETLAFSRVFPRSATVLKRELAEELGIGVRQAVFWKSLDHEYEERGFGVFRM